MAEYQQINRASWDERAPAHAASPEYAVESFARDPAHLSNVVRFDVPRLGSVEGLRGVHLQCHIGTDTVSLARLGARMTGLDFSPTAVVEARKLATAAGADVDFVESDVYAAREALGAEMFDLVFTGIGALCWLPDIARWAEVVASLLKPGGRLFLREGHPMMWSLADIEDDGALRVEHAYFERTEPTVWNDEDTYVTTDAVFTNNETHEWNHGLGEQVTALLERGFELTQLVEHDSVPWEAFPGRMEQLELGEWRLTDRPWRLPHSYTLQAVLRG